MKKKWILGIGCSVVLATAFVFVIGRKKIIGATPSKFHSLNHIAIIGDGNRRWAKKNNVHKFIGHKIGFTEAAPKIIEYLFNSRIHTVTLWCSSPENWGREKAEIENFHQCFNKLLKIIIGIASKYGIKIKHLGRKNRIPEYLRNTIISCESITKNNSNHIFNIGIDYGARDEICRAVNKIIKNNPHTKKISEKQITENLDTSSLQYPNPDLIVRTSGEQRLSGFMAWQSTYSEFYFCKKYFPELSIDDISKIIKDYAMRHRRFGK